MRVVLGLARVSHTIALHGFREDHRWLAGMMRGGVVGGIHLERIVAAAVQPVDVIVGQIFHHLQKRFVLTEEVIANVCAIFGLVVLVFTVDGFVHALLQATGVVLRKQRVPQPAPHHFQDVPARSAEVAFQLLDDLAVAPYRPIQAL